MPVTIWLQRDGHYITSYYHTTFIGDKIWNIYILYAINLSFESIGRKKSRSLCLSIKHWIFFVTKYPNVTGITQSKSCSMIKNSSSYTKNINYKITVKLRKSNTRNKNRFCTVNIPENIFFSFLRSRTWRALHTRCITSTPEIASNVCLVQKTTSPSIRYYSDTKKSKFIHIYLSILNAYFWCPKSWRALHQKNWKHA